MAGFFWNLTLFKIFFIFNCVYYDIGCIHYKLDNFHLFQLLIKILNLIQIYLALKYSLLNLEHQHIIGGLYKTSLELNLTIQTITHGIQLELAPLTEVAFFSVLVVRGVLGQSDLQLMGRKDLY